jgi:hypothetical protein
MWNLQYTEKEKRKTTKEASAKSKKVDEQNRTDYRKLRKDKREAEERLRKG